MLEYVEQLFARYRRSGLLIDTNLLVLYLVGLLDPSQIISFKRTNAYTTDDLPLYHFLAETGVDAINFNNLRPLNW